MIRNLKTTDYKRYIKLAESDIPENYFNTFLTDVLNNNHIIIVMEDPLQNLIGTGTLLIEEKLTHGGCKMGHIENILVHQEYRGNGHGEILVNYLLDIAKTNGCYRVDLNCHSELENFYKKNNFNKDNISMNIYFKNNFK
jgi:glucosamine-phosphate N-acetyltransferase